MAVRRPSPGGTHIKVSAFPACPAKDFSWSRLIPASSSLSVSNVPSAIMTAPRCSPAITPRTTRSHSARGAVTAARSAKRSTLASAPPSSKLLGPRVTFWPTMGASSESMAKTKSMTLALASGLLNTNPAPPAAMPPVASPKNLSRVSIAPSCRNP